MIGLYVASRTMTRENREICVRLTLPAGDKKIWAALQKTEMATVDDCEISDVECEVEAADQWLKEIGVHDADIFELNTFARMLAGMTEAEKENFGRWLKEKKPKTLKEAVFREEELRE